MSSFVELFKEPGFAAVAGALAGISGNIIAALIASRTQRRSEVFQLDAKNRVRTLKRLISFSNELAEASLPDEEPVVVRFRFAMKKHYLNILDTEVYFLPRKMAKIIDWIETCHGDCQVLYLTNDGDRLEKKLEAGLGNKAHVLKQLAMNELNKLTR